jgi:hypothetical protein
VSRRFRILALAILLGAASGEGADKLHYYGGPVLTHVNLVQVLWGTGAYLSGVADGGVVTTTKLGDFYETITKSRYLDWLREYDTPTQAIGRGTFAGTFTITPSICATTPCSVTDAQIQAELKSQIAAAHLPTPDENTVYMLSFPADVSITVSQFGVDYHSCTDFCGYHFTATYTGPSYLYYSVMPDISAGACYTACQGSLGFDEATLIASHEILEPITDPAVGALSSQTIEAPVAWYDATQGDPSEIADICTPASASFLAPNGVTYVVAKGWSNQAAACVAVSPYALGDVDGSGSVDVADVFNLINALFASGPAPLGPADVNTDGHVDVADVFYLINYLFASGPAPF